MKHYLVTLGVVVLGLSSEAFGGLPLDVTYFEDKGALQAPKLVEVLAPAGRNPQRAVACLALNARKFVQNESSKDPKEAAIQGAGFSFPGRSPWVTLLGKYVASIASKDFGLPVGDWGCGYGFTSQVVLMGGGRPYGLEHNKPVAAEANELLAGCKPYLPTGTKLRDSYRVFVGSVLNPPHEFMARLNHINICYHVLHFMPPEAADALLANLWKNTAEGGILFITAFTPEGHSPLDPSVIQTYYAENAARGEKYPGFGIYTISAMQSLDGKNFGNLTRSVSRPSKKDLKRLSIGKQYIGPFGPAGLVGDTGQIITIRDKRLEEGLGPLCKCFIPYAYSTEHMMMNLFRPEDLAKALEREGFRVINAWLTSEVSEVLYPASAPLPPETHGQVAVVVAQKPRGPINEAVSSTDGQK